MADGRGDGQQQHAGKGLARWVGGDDGLLGARATACSEAMDHAGEGAVLKRFDRRALTAIRAKTSAIAAGSDVYENAKNSAPDARTLFGKPLPGGVAATAGTSVPFTSTDWVTTSVQVTGTSIERFPLSSTRR